MLQNSYSFFINSSCQSNNIYKFELDQNVDLSDIQNISVQQIYFPKNLNQIQNDFTITIDGVDINFFAGFISFNQISLLIQNKLGTDYQAGEFLKSNYQNSGKLQIKRIDNQFFQIQIPEQWIEFFGSLMWDGQNSYISSQICNLTTEKTIMIRSNACMNKYQQNGNYDILYCFQFATTPELDYYQENYIDIIQNKQQYTKTRIIQLQFQQMDGSPVIFQNCASFYIKIVIFKYNNNLPDNLISNQIFLIQYTKQLIELTKLKFTKQKIQSFDDDHQQSSSNWFNDL